MGDRLRSRWLLKGLPISVEGPCTSAGLSKQQLQRLVGALGGRPVDEAASASIRLFEDLEAARRRQARGLLETGKGDTSNRTVSFLVSTHWLLDCIKTWSCRPFDPYLLRLSSDEQKAGETQSLKRDKSIRGKEIERRHRRGTAALNQRMRLPPKQRNNSSSGIGKNTNSSSNSSRGSSKKRALANMADEPTTCEPAPKLPDPCASTLPQQQEQEQQQEERQQQKEDQQQQQQQQQQRGKARQSKTKKRSKGDTEETADGLKQSATNANPDESSSPRVFAQITQKVEEDEEEHQRRIETSREVPPSADVSCDANAAAAAAAAAAVEGASLTSPIVSAQPSNPHSPSSVSQSPSPPASPKGAASLRGAHTPEEDMRAPSVAEQLEVAGLFEEGEGENNEAFDFDLGQQQGFSSQQQNDAAVCSSSSSSKQEALGVLEELIQRHGVEDENAPANYCLL
ncbi:hypothetical protein ACSSS7_008124 [Eimeria intestinalis]